jgi:hypothetical protein
MEEGMRFKFERKDVIFWICIVGIITSLILKQFYSPPFEDIAFAFVAGALVYLYTKIVDIQAIIGDIKGDIGEIRGKLELLPTSEEVRRIIREELKRR